ncbi:hypothetical protein V6N13_039270 [Hibiscus sabdariffa]
MALQATATASASYLLMRRMIPVKARGNACFASNNSSAGASQQGPRAVTGRYQDQAVRPLQNFSPDRWGDRFLTLPFTNSEFESCSSQVELMKKMVKNMLMSSRDDPIENILLINSLLRLGVSYHFEIEIEEQLSHLFATFSIDSKDYDLHTVAVVFQVFRSHGYKMSCGLILIDDTYDAYGLYQELQLLKRAVERWHASAVDELPGEYLRNLYEAFLDISDEVEEAVRKEGRSSSVFYAKEVMKKQVQGYHVEARWLHENMMPTFGEYLENGIWSIGAITTVALHMMGMREADEDAYRWLLNCDATILRAMCLLSRLYNDMQSNEVVEFSKDEEGRGGQISGITCYMKEHGVSKEEAVEGFRERIKVLWKDVNEGFMETPMHVPKQILMAAFNVARVSEVCYKYDNGFTKPETTYKDYITKVLIDPIPLEE